MRRNSDTLFNGIIEFSARYIEKKVQSLASLKSKNNLLNVDHNFFFLNKFTLNSEQEEKVIIIL
jgi:hypothetical protein